ncbi:hypothetical protein A5633_16890 [Mycolicibacterium elephantis]|uniref:hypothetical protein n=1 Tax=Mycolicibacterium elephantis TaxID=81858 RepID=UPI0007EA7F06|nr:hypothetical protein [Mycolicibacterium elephantis]OBA79707.1 hypothetical protein A5633_16890 [Mycolicibacterium elephantis]
MADRKSRLPSHLFGGRIRTSTLALIVAFVAVLWLQQTYEPEPKPEPPATQFVPPGFVPDPNYTWVPRTRVRQPTTTPPTTTTTTTTPTTTPPTTTTTTPTTPTTTPTTEGAPTTTVVDPDGPGPLAPQTQTVEPPPAGPQNPAPFAPGWGPVTTTAPPS